MRKGIVIIRVESRVLAIDDVLPIVERLAEISLESNFPSLALVEYHSKNILGLSWNRRCNGFQVPGVRLVLTKYFFPQLGDYDGCAIAE